ncbi:MAG TPA: FAD binding domain-containing protein [Chthoniobacterales bacterium]
MDLNTITDIRQPKNPEEIGPWEKGFAWLGGGTWLFSEPQVDVSTLIDLDSFNWPDITVTDAGLEIAATCKIVTLNARALPSEWTAAPLVGFCTKALLMSFKIWNMATVGGNICMSLPAGGMISLTAALEGVLTLWPKSGEPRQLSVLDFVTGNNRNVLQPGELLRSIFIPASALKKEFAWRRFSLTQVGRSSVFVIGTKCPQTGTFLLTITASTARPVQISFPGIPSAERLKSAIASAVLPELWFDDVHGSPVHREHLTHYFAEQIREELS